ncbi:MAG TPA: histidine kinase, partial [Nocardioides sp.]|nr:histidine kinase [Nocardioides sp.]
MAEDCDRPEPEAYQPRISVWGHIWRLVLTLTLSAVGWFPLVDDQTEAQWMLDVALGVLAYVLVMGFRRRWPVPVALAAGLMAGGSAIASGPAALASVSVATRRRWREIALVGSVGFAAAQFFVTW